MNNAFFEVPIPINEPEKIMLMVLKRKKSY